MSIFDLYHSLIVKVCFYSTQWPIDSGGVLAALLITELKRLTRSSLWKERFILAHGVKVSRTWRQHGSRQEWRLWQLPAHMYTAQGAGNRQEVLSHTVQHCKSLPIVSIQFLQVPNPSKTAGQLDQVCKYMSLWETLTFKPQHSANGPHRVMASSMQNALSAST